MLVVVENAFEFCIFIKNKLKEPPIDKISFMVQDIAYAYKIFKILYIANHSRRKTFAINRIELETFVVGC